MNSVLLVNANSCTLAKIYPIGLDYLSSILKKEGYLVEGLDLAVIKKSSWNHVLREKISQNNYLAIGISIRNLNDEIPGGKNYLPEIFQLIIFIRSLITQSKSRSQIVLGGSGFSLMPQVILEETQADYGVVGEGEESLITLLKNLENGIKDLPKLWHKSTDISSKIYQRGSWGNFHHYFKNSASGNLQTKRGCPMNCLYCEYPNIERKKFRFRKPELVADEFLQLERLGFPRIYIIDATFNNPLSQAKEILRAFKRAKTKKPWTAFLNPRFLDQEFFELVKETNGEMPLKFTIESGSDLILQNLQKSFRQSDIKRAAAFCRKNKIAFSFTMLFGGPGETKGTVAETCQLIKELSPSYVSSSIGIFIHPRTPLAKMTKGTLWKNEKDFFDPILYPCQNEQIIEWVKNDLGHSSIKYQIYRGQE